MDNETKKLQEGDVVEVVPTADNETALAKAQEAADALLEEVKELRKKNAELKSKLESPEIVKPEPATVPTEIESVVAAVLEKRDKEISEKVRKENLANAISKFRQSHSDFHPDNDKDDIKFSLIQKELESFNLSKYSSEEDFAKVIEKAGVLAGVIKPSVEPESVKLETSTPIPNSGGGSSMVKNADTLTKEEKAYIEKTSWSEERLKNLKSMMPAEAYARMILGE